MNNPFQQTMITLYVPKHMSGSISISGFSLDVDDDGLVVVPKDLAPVLRAHGLTDPPPVESKKTKGA